MKIEKIMKKITNENQYDVALQACHNDCLEYFSSGSWEVSMFTSQGVNCHDPSTEDIKKGVELSNDLGISFCFSLDTPKTSAYL